MENFDRVGPSPFRDNGDTLDTDICFSGGSKLEIYGGSPYNNFRLKFSNRSNEGWWVNPGNIDQLIAELLYIRRDIQKFKDGVALDIEVGAAPAAAWDSPEFVDEEEEDDAPY